MYTDCGITISSLAQKMYRHCKFLFMSFLWWNFKSRWQMLSVDFSFNSSITLDHILLSLLSSLLFQCLTASSIMRFCPWQFGSCNWFFFIFYFFKCDECCVWFFVAWEREGNAGRGGFSFEFPDISLLPTWLELLLEISVFCYTSASESARTKNNCDI